MWRHSWRRPTSISLLQDWSRTWDQETTGKEDSLRSPYLDTEFDKAREVMTVLNDNNDEDDDDDAGRVYPLLQHPEYRRLLVSSH